MLLECTSVQHEFIKASTQPQGLAEFPTFLTAGGCNLPKTLSLLPSHVPLLENPVGQQAPKKSTLDSRSNCYPTGR